MNSYIKTIAIIAVFALVIGISPIMVKAVDNGGDDVTTSSTANTSMTNGSDDAVSQNGATVSNGGDDVGTGSVSGGAVSQTPSNPTITNGGDDEATGTTNGGDDTNTGANNNPAIVNGDDDVNQNNPATTNGNDDTTTNPAGNITTGGSNGGGSSGGSSGGRSTNRTTGGITTTVATNTNLPTLINISDCTYITEYMKFGRANNSAEVTKLQKFLRDTEELDVEVTGNFDEKTKSAVESFQAKYVDEIMLPWGVTTPTGQVWYTTKNKINEIYCKKNFSLTAEQLAEIEAYRNGIVDGTLTVDAEGNIINTNDDSTTTTEVGSITEDNSQVAGVAGSGVLGKIWAWILWLFGF